MRSDEELSEESDEPAPGKEPKPYPISGSRKAVSDPHPVRIFSVEGFTVTALWNTGDIRRNDFTAWLPIWGHDTYWWPMTNELIFNDVEIFEQSFGWSHAPLELEDHDRKKFPKRLDPAECYRQSKVVQAYRPAERVAHLIKSERVKAGLTQAELAARIGYTYQYISKIERGVTDVNFGVVTYILRVGLGKDLVVADYVESTTL